MYHGKSATTLSLLFILSNGWNGFGCSLFGSLVADDRYCKKIAGAFAKTLDNQLTHTNIFI